MNKKSQKILVTPRSLSKNGHPALHLLENAGFTILMPWPGKQPSEEELLQVLPKCVGYLAGVEKISRKVLESCPDLRIISRNGVGIDNIDIDAANKYKISITGTPGANSQGVAELALTLLLTGLRSVVYSSYQLKAGRWERKKGTEVAGKTLGIIGCGQVGQRLAKMAVGIGMNVIGYDKYKSLPSEKIKGFRYCELTDVIKQSDAISLHCPPEKQPLFDADMLNKVKNGVCIVNTARVGLVDTDAMYAAIQHGKVGHYASDVFNKEPPELTPLLLDDRVTVTPHLGGFTTESIKRATEAAVANILHTLIQIE